MLVLETPRLALRWFGADDADMLVELLNDPDWLRHIGDRAVRTREQAQSFVANRLVASYWRQGFGLWAMQRRDGGACVGMCGLVRRDFLPDLDLGYALLPAHRGQGLVREAAAACLAYARDVLGEHRVLALMSPQNEASRRVVAGLGMRHLETSLVAVSAEPTEIHEWSAAATERDDAAQIEALVARFLAAFTNRAGRVPTVAALPHLFLPGASICTVTAEGAVATDVCGFVAPRAELLFSGRLRDFEEWETGHDTRIDGALAQRSLRYRKHGQLDGAPYAGGGTKALHLVRTERGWRIAALAWRDDPA